MAVDRRLGSGGKEALGEKEPDMRNLNRFLLVSTIIGLAAGTSVAIQRRRKG